MRQRLTAIRVTPSTLRSFAAFACSVHLPWSRWFLWFRWRTFRAEQEWLRHLIQKSDEVMVCQVAWDGVVRL
jgi:hypothetical protein